MELSVHQDKILNAMARYKSQEAERASDAGEMREDIGNLIELTGLNKKAFSIVRSIDKLPEEKREDVLRSLTPLLEMMDKHWHGQSTPDMLDRADEAAEAPETDFDDDHGDIPPPDDGEEEGPDAFDPDIEEEDEAFNAQLRAVQ